MGQLPSLGEARTEGGHPMNPAEELRAYVIAGLAGLVVIAALTIIFSFLPA